MLEGRAETLRENSDTREFYFGLNQRSRAPFLNFVERVIAVVERRNERSARVGSLATGQDDGRRGTQTNDGIGRERRADTAPVQAKDPKRTENEGDSEQCHS